MSAAAAQRRCTLRDTEETIAWLRKLCLFQTSSGQLVTVPTFYTLPPEEQWFSLLRIAEVESHVPRSLLRALLSDLMLASTRLAALQCEPGISGKVLGLLQHLEQRSEVSHPGGNEALALLTANPLDLVVSRFPERDSLPSLETELIRSKKRDIAGVQGEEDETHSRYTYKRLCMATDAFACMYCLEPEQKDATPIDQWEPPLGDMGGMVNVEQTSRQDPSTQALGSEPYHTNIAIAPSLVELPSLEPAALRKQLVNELKPIRMFFRDLLLSAVSKTHQPSKSSLALYEWIRTRERQLRGDSQSAQDHPTSIDLPSLSSALFHLHSSSGQAKHSSTLVSESASAQGILFGQWEDCTASDLVQACRRLQDLLITDVRHSFKKLLTLANCFSALGLVSDLLQQPIPGRYTHIVSELKEEARVESSSQPDGLLASILCANMPGNIASWADLLNKFHPPIVDSTYGMDDAALFDSSVHRTNYDLAAWAKTEFEFAQVLIAVALFIIAMCPRTYFDGVSVEGVFILRCLIVPVIGLNLSRPADKRTVGLLLNLLRGTTRRPLRAGVTLLYIVVSPFLCRGLLPIVGVHQAELIVSLLTSPQFGLVNDPKEQLVRQVLSSRSDNSPALADSSSANTSSLSAVRLVAQDPLAVLLGLSMFLQPEGTSVDAEALLLADAVITCHAWSYLSLFPSIQPLAKHAVEQPGFNDKDESIAVVSPSLINLLIKTIPLRSRLFVYPQTQIPIHFAPAPGELLRILLGSLQRGATSAIPQPSIVKCLQLAITNMSQFKTDPKLKEFVRSQLIPLLPELSQKVIKNLVDR